MGPIIRLDWVALFCFCKKVKLMASFRSLGLKANTSNLIYGWRPHVKIFFINDYDIRDLISQFFELRKVSPTNDCI